MSFFDKKPLGLLRFVNFWSEIVSIFLTFFSVWLGFNTIL